MTTLEPGASDVLTHGLPVRPRSTAFLASSAAPIITDGLDVLVHEVIAAITTAPWSSSHCVPSSRVTSVGRLGRPSEVAAAETYSRGEPAPLPPRLWAGGSLAGNDSADDSSTATPVSVESLPGDVVRD